MKKKKITKKIKAWAIKDKECILTWWCARGMMEEYLQYEIFYRKSGAMLAKKEWEKWGNEVKVIPLTITYE